jgi:hypothetical protein
MSTSANLDAIAIDASAERKLAGIKSQRVNRAETSLTAARDRLARAQLAEEKAAADLATYDWHGNRQRVLDARQEIELATSLVQHAERALDKAKARATPAERQAAIDLVTAERARGTLTADLTPHLAKIRTAAMELIGAVQEVIARCSQQSSHGVLLRDAHDALGLPYSEAALMRAPDPTSHVAAAVLDACKRVGFSPWDWRDIIAPSRAVPMSLATPGAQAVISPNHVEEQAAVNARVRRELEQQVERSEIAKAAERRQRATVNMTPSVTPTRAPLPARSFGDRASLMDD